MSEAQAVEQQAPALPIPEMKRAAEPTWDDFPEGTGRVSQAAPPLLRCLGGRMTLAVDDPLPVTYEASPRGGILVSYTPRHGQQEEMYLLNIKEGLDTNQVIEALRWWKRGTSRHLEYVAATLTWALWAWFEPPQRVG